jgi:methylated-DNA-[protein]-cysteine S-methyltransferase
MQTAWIDKLETSPLGPVWVALSERGLVAVEYDMDLEEFAVRLQRLGFARLLSDPRVTQPAVRQLGEYLQGQRKDFDLPIDWSVMRPFQEKVLRETFAIPYGQVTTYGELARKLGKPGAARAVGRAQATNPMPLVIPCHRVIGSDGGLHGYGGPGGIPTKEWLLRMERD